ncbi:hypothetical protein QNI19_34460 [Cytophagaceae bacterium DM2B3-1]|uniref:Uncharacterized protein n=1 Tax=Xanthocytophaga flava TaxID=3048013 RepID=A0ABT7CYY8_9BACT|nr:hypothetical protein [Xanthocytophaga flavus]MDJ1498097.1 hypothetical protein [Xanthocytophaga flavus]
MARVDEKQYQALLRALRKLQWAVDCHGQVFEEKDHPVTNLKQMEEDLLRFQQEYQEKEQALRQAQQEFSAGIKQIRLQMIQQAHQIRKVLVSESVSTSTLGIPKGLIQNIEVLEKKSA